MDISGLSLVRGFAEASHGATQHATEKAAENGNVLATLGIDWKMLVYQLISFSILVFLLSKYVFPILIRAIDDRQSAIEESLAAAKNAEKNAADAEEKIAALMDKARKEAGEVVVTAKEEANAMLSRAEAKAKTQADHIVAQARDTIDKEVLAAKKALHNETIELVAQATEKVVGKTVSTSVDKKIIKDSLEKAGK